MSGILQLINTFPSGGFAVKNSLRFRQAASAYLNRTSVASPTNNKVLTISAWVKRGIINDSNFDTLFGGYSTQGDTLGFGSGTNNGGDAIQLRDSAVGAYNILTTPVYRDPSAWYHLVVSIDTTQATASNRVLIYVNGTQVTSFSSSSYPSQNYVFEWNAGSTNSVIGRRSSSSGIWYFDGYMAEINFIDGQALTPSSFGAFDATSGVWQPVKYSGTYGTNGFYLKFSDTTSTTTLCYDYSGNSNNWTSNNISLTSGSTYDSMLDSPTNYDNGGNGVGNYCVWNPLDTSGSTVNANLSASTSGFSGYGTTRATFGMSSGKWYWEVTPTSFGDGGTIGIATAFAAISAQLGANAYGWGYLNGGSTYTNASAAAYGASYTTNDVIGVAFDADAGTLTFYKNNTSQGVAFSGLTSGPYFPAVSDNGGGTTGSVLAVTFGQRPFAYTPPTGYKALNTQNLPAASIVNGASFMAATLYTGNGTSQTVTNTVNGVSFTPDLVWNKGRSVAYNHSLVDVIRGNSNVLFSNDTSAEQNPGAQLDITTNGFISTYRAANLANNQSGATYVCWQWKAGGTAVTNNAGSITSQVSANTTAGFSVVTWTGSASASNQTTGHGLGTAPSMVILKNRSVSDNWFVYHSSATANNQYLNLNTTSAVTTAGSNTWGAGMTSSVVGLRPGTFCGSSADLVVMYCFAAIPGYSAFGSYTGNGSSDGPFVFLGFRPRFILAKSATVTGSWCIFDTSRSAYNVTNLGLLPNLSNAEATETNNQMDFLSNGFKLRAAGGSDPALNTSGQTIIYAAFAENPLKYSLAR